MVIVTMVSLESFNCDKNVIQKKYLKNIVKLFYFLWYFGSILGKNF